jgi:hypothetical protein
MVTTLHGHLTTPVEYEPKRYLYRYLSKDGAVKTLKDFQLRLGPWASMNDPREAKRWSAQDVLVGSPLSEVALQEEVDRVLRRSARLASFVGDGAVDPSAAPRWLYHRGWAHSSAWDRYAARHTGVCLVFNRRLLEAEFSRFSDSESADGNITSMGPVAYEDSPITIRLTQRFRDLDALREALSNETTRGRLVTHLYMTKAKCWESENETRLAWVGWHTPPLKIDNPVYFRLKNSLQALIFGESFGDTTDVLKDVDELRDDQRPELFRCSWRHGKPDLIA